MPGRVLRRVMPIERVVSSGICASSVAVAAVVSVVAKSPSPPLMGPIFYQLEDRRANKCSPLRIQRFELVLELVRGLERPVDGRKSDVRDAVELAQMQ